MAQHRMSSAQRRRVRPQVWERDGRKCFWCDTPLALEDMTLDHLETRGSGGSNRKENLVCACDPCNQRRGKMTVDQWVDRTWLKTPTITSASAGHA